MYPVRDHLVTARKRSSAKVHAVFTGKCLSKSSIGGVLHPGGFSIRGGFPSGGVLHPDKKSPSGDRLKRSRWGSPSYGGGLHPGGVLHPGMS